VAKENPCRLGEIPKWVIVRRPTSGEADAAIAALYRRTFQKVGEVARQVLQTRRCRSAWSLVRQKKEDRTIV
jgi:hypothetical protein